MIMGKNLTSRSDDYSKWYNELVVQADLAENSAVRGCMVIKPYGYAIWEKMQAELDRMFKETGHQNAYFPLLVPKSLFEAEEKNADGDEETTPPESLSSLAVASFWKKAGQSPVFLLQEIKPTVEHDSVVGVTRSAHNGIESAIQATRVLFWCISGNSFNELLVRDDDSVTKRRDKLFDGSLPLFSLCGFRVLDHGTSQSIEVSSDDLNWQKDGNSHKVEHVMDGGAGKGTLELVAVSHLSHGDNGVGDRSSNVGSHNHVDTLLDADSASGKGDNDRGGGGGGLQKNSSKDTNHEASNGVGVVTKKALQPCSQT